MIMASINQQYQSLFPNQYDHLSDGCSSDEEFEEALEQLEGIGDLHISPSNNTSQPLYTYRGTSIPFSEFIEKLHLNAKASPEHILRKKGVEFEPQITSDFIQNTHESAQYFHNTVEVAYFIPEKSRSADLQEKVTDISENRDLQTAIYKLSVLSSSIFVATETVNQLKLNPTFKSTFGSTCSILQTMGHKINGMASALDICVAFYCLNQEAFDAKNIKQLLAAYFPLGQLPTDSVIKNIRCLISNVRLNKILEYTDTSAIVTLTHIFNQIEPQLTAISHSKNQSIFSDESIKSWLENSHEISCFFPNLSPAANILKAALINLPPTADNGEKLTFIKNFVLEGFCSVILECSEQITASIEAVHNNRQKVKATENDTRPSECNIVTLSSYLSRRFWLSLKTPKNEKSEDETLGLVRASCFSCETSLAVVSYKYSLICVNKDLQSFIIASYPGKGMNYCRICFEKNLPKLKFTSSQHSSSTSRTANSTGPSGGGEHSQVNSSLIRNEPFIEHYT